jgi:hypothetical protein
MPHARARARAALPALAALRAALVRLCLALALLTAHGAHEPAPAAPGLMLEICGAHGSYEITLPGAPENPASHAPLCCLAACAAALAEPPGVAPAPRLAFAAAADPAPPRAPAPPAPARDAHRSRAPPLPA